MRPCRICHGIIGKWQYLMQPSNNTGLLFQPLEDTIHQQFIPQHWREEWKNPTLLPCLPRCLNPVAITNGELNTSEMISAPLKFINQTDTFTKPDLHHIKLQVQTHKHWHSKEDTNRQVKGQLPEPLHRTLNLASERGILWLCSHQLQDQV